MCDVVAGGVTDLFVCPKGLKQGEITSPLLFSLFINEAATDIMKNGMHGVQMFPDILEIFILLFADDVALVSDTPRGLQNQLDVLARNSDALDLSVNLDKSNIIVFRNGGYLASNEHWSFNGQEVAVVNLYKYLGLYFSTRLSFSKAFEELATKARRGVIEIFKVLWKLGDFSPSLFLKMFDSQIKPVLMYASEVWGMYDHYTVEKVHLFALKKLLNVSPCTPNDMAYGETGRYPLYVQARANCIRYWQRLVRMEDERLPHKAYKMLLLLHDSGKDCWATNIRSELYRNGFGLVWENQSVGNINWFLRVYKQRLIDSFCQDWHSHVNESARFTVYRHFKSSVYLETYFVDITNKHLRDLYIRFRIGASEIQTHKHRYTSDSRHSLQCPLCNSRLEDEMHFLFFCKKLEALRHRFIPAKYTKFPTYITLNNMFNDGSCLQAVARYIYYGLKLRKEVV